MRRTPWAARAAAVAVVALAALTLAPAALAHARLLGSTPANGAVLAHAPRQVTIHFSDTVVPATGAAAIRNGDGSVLAGSERTSGTTAVVPLRQGLEDGDYTVRWRVLSDDGHLLEGVLAFAVGEGRAPPTAQLPLLGSGPRWGFALARWLFLLGTLLAFGAVAFRAVAFRALPGPGGRPELEGPTFVTLSTAFAIALAGAGLSLVAVPEALDTRFGKAAVAGIVVAAVGVALAEVARSVQRWPLAAAPAAIALVAVATAGSHALDPGRLRALAVAVDLVHIGAAGIWIGGLVQLALVLPRLDRDDRGPLLRRFAVLAAAAVATVAATGIGRAAFGLDSVHQAWDTGYGRALLVKTGLLAAALAAGALARRRFGGGGSHRGQATPPRARVRLALGAELLILAAIVATVAVLGDLRPGRSAGGDSPALAARTVPPLPAADAVVLAREEGDVAFAVAIRAIGVAQLELTASALGPDGLGVDRLAVDLGADGPPRPATRCGPGCYTLVVPAPARLREVTLSLDGRRRPPFVLPAWPPKPAAPLVARAAAAFAGLRTLVIQEQLASSPRARQTSRQRIVAPDRFAYAIDGGGAGVVIGGRRWDRFPGTAGWTAQAAQPLRLPRAAWGEAPTNAYELGRTTLDGHAVHIVTLLDPGVPAWFTVWIDARRELPLRLEMTAAAHFMVDRYGPFNGPLSIVPPAGR